MRLVRQTLRAKTLLTILAALIVVAFVWARLVVYQAPVKAAGVDQATPNSNASPSGGQAQSLDLTKEQAASLEVGAVKLRDFEILKTSVGTIDFNEDMLVQVFSQYPGKILKALYNVGDDVKKGDVLFTIDSPDLLQAESTLLATAGVLKLQKRTLARLTALLKTGGSAQKDVDLATSEEQTAEANFNAARNAVRIFGKTDTEVAKILADRKVDSTLAVPSPISGRVVSRNAAPGFLTQPGTPPAPYQVADISTMWMNANVVETDAPAYKVGQDVEVRVPAYPGKVFKGHVTTVGSMIDPNTHRQLVRSQIDDPGHLLRSGMYASFVIHVGKPEHSLAVPADAVVREGDGTMTVWVTTDSRHFVKRTVKTGFRQSGRVQILDGLHPNETVVTKGAVFLSNQLALGEAG